MKKVLILLLSLFLLNLDISLAQDYQSIKILQNTNIAGGYHIKLILRKKEKNFAEGSRWSLGFPLNSYLHADFSLGYLRLKESSNNFRSYFWKSGLSISLVPKKRVNPFFLLGVTEEIIKTNSGNENGAGILIGAGIEIALSKYAFMQIYADYFNQSPYNDEGKEGGILFGSCYKYFCLYFRSEFFSKTQVWQDSETLRLEAGIMLNFSAKKFLKKIEETFKNPYFP